MRALGFTILFSALFAGLFVSPVPAQWIGTELVNSSGNGTVPIGAATGLDIGPAGELYVADSVAGRVLRVEQDGSVTVILDAATVQGFLLGGPGSVAVDSIGNVYVSAFSTNNVIHIAPNGVATEIADISGDGNGNELDTPVDLAVDDQGRVYVACARSDNAFRIDTDGTITEIIDESGDGTHRLRNARGISVTEDGTVYVGGYFSHNAFRIRPNGQIEQIIDASGNGRSPLTRTQDVIEDRDGNVYVSGRSSSNVFRIGPGGAIDVVLDAAGDGRGNPFVGPDDGCMEIDSRGNVYVAGLQSDTVFRIAPDGQLTVMLDPAGVAGAPLDGPCGVALGPTTEVFVGACVSDNVFRQHRESDAAFALVLASRFGAPGTPERILALRPLDTGATLPIPALEAPAFVRAALFTTIAGRPVFLRSTAPRSWDPGRPIRLTELLR